MVPSVLWDLLVHTIMWVHLWYFLLVLLDLEDKVH